MLVATAARLGIFDILAKEGMTAETLSVQLDIERDPLERILKALVALYLLEVKEKNTFIPTSQGRLLTDGHEETLKAIAIYKGSPIVWEPLGKLFEALKKKKAPFTLHFETELFDYLSQHPEDMEIFQNAMDCYTWQSSSALLHAYDFTPFSCVLDIGGGRGTFLKKMRSLFPHIHGTTFDMPTTLSHVHDGIQCISGSFFDEIPGGFDAYLLRNILHDWSDEKCIKILSTIRNALADDTPLLIIETLVDEDGAKRLGRFADITMFTMTPGGRERSLKEFTTLLHEAGFSIASVVKTSGSKALIDARISRSS